MGSVNDHKIVAKQSINSSKLLPTAKKLTDTQQQRFGFYILIISAISGIKDPDEIVSTIIDTDFCGNVLGLKNSDEGIDAIVIDDEARTINLFSFKYRESFSPGRQQKLGDAVDSIKLLAAIADENTTPLDERTKELTEQVIERLKSGEIWKLNLYMVSNDNVPLKVDEPFIGRLEDDYDLAVRPIVLDDIIAHTSLAPESAVAEIFLDIEAVMTFEESALSSSKSYLLRVPVPDVIRITSSDPEMRARYDLDDLSQLKDSKLSTGLLFENVRGYLGDTDYNRNIATTLDEAPSRFFMYNNGITITADSIQASQRNGGKKLLVKLSDFQIVNGGQTIRSIYAVKDSSFDEEKLANASVLVRVFQTEGDSTLTNSIAEFTNSQNAISSSDLKSVSNLQVQLEAYFKEHGIKYIRKSGDVGEDEQDTYRYSISMERLAQIIFAKMGHPDKASNQKKRLFNKYYYDIFSNDIDFDKLVDDVAEYEEVKSLYAGRGRAYEQKYFYVMYLNSRNNSTIDSNIELVEEVLKEYRSGEDITEARKLIQRGFKELLDKKAALKPKS